MISGERPAFDPYHVWLGIPASEQPADLYRVLGLRTFESNPLAIESAADRLHQQLQTALSGPHGSAAHFILNQVATSRLTLLDSARKSAYDAHLRDRASFSPPVVPLPAAPLPLPTQPLTVELADSNSTAAPHFASGYPKRPAENPVLTLVKIIAGGAAGIGLGVVILWFGFHRDPFGLFEGSKNALQASKTERGKLPQNPDSNAPKDTADLRDTSSGSSLRVVPISPIPATVPSTAQMPLQSPQNDNRGSIPTGLSSSSRPNAVDSKHSTGFEEPGNGSASLNTESNTSASTELSRPSTALVPPELSPKKFAPPSPEVQKAKLADLKQIYKVEFDASMKPANREPFVDFLVANASRLKSDSDAQFVLFREAYDRAVAIKQFVKAAGVIDSIESRFEVDPFRLRIHLISQASSAARQPGDRLVVVRAALEMAQAAADRDRTSDAQKLASLTATHLKLLPDAEYRQQAARQIAKIGKLTTAEGSDNEASVDIVSPGYQITPLRKCSELLAGLE
jgi:hypothetical protein